MLQATHGHARGAGPLLQAPPFGGRRRPIIVAAHAVTRTGALPPAGLAAAILAAKIGGPFWRRPAERIPAAALDVLIDASGDPAAAALLWRAAVETMAAARVGVLIPRTRSAAELAARARAAGSPVISWPVDPHAILARAAEVHAPAVTATGTLALLAGRRFLVGLPGAQLEADAAAALRAIASLPYRDPFTGAAAEVGETVSLLAEWRRVIDANRRVGACAGMSLWKRRRIAQLLTWGEGAPPFRRRAEAAVRAASEHCEAGIRPGVAVWSTREPAGLEATAEAQATTLVRVEDGFIRSLGLGSDLLPPASIVVDEIGLYLDPRRPSALELLLAESRFDDALLARARRLRAALVGGGISKYGASGAEPALASAGLPTDGLPTDGRRRVLVTGQVADDLSMRLGGGGAVRDNLALLRAARAAAPDACIIYRPHPDVEAGHRPGALRAEDTARHADLVLRGGSIARLIERVDEVHTITSLAGFEALLRGRRVVTYGQPFYAGWGLTVDAAPVARRQRRLSLDELVAGVLILFPRYVDPRTGWPCSPELLLTRLGEVALWQPTPLMRARRLQGRLRLAAAAAWRARERDRSPA